VLVVTDDQERVGAERAAGKVACPGCGGRLRPSGFGPRRVVAYLERLGARTGATGSLPGLRRQHTY
jgi:hypothetical protein